MVVFKDDARVNGPGIQVVKLFESFYDAVFQGFRQGHIVRR